MHLPFAAQLCPLPPTFHQVLRTSCGRGRFCCLVLLLGHRIRAGLLTAPAVLESQFHHMQRKIQTAKKEEENYATRGISACPRCDLIYPTYLRFRLFCGDVSQQ